jgi:hypothetical protein
METGGGSAREICGKWEIALNLKMSAPAIVLGGRLSEWRYTQAVRESRGPLPLRIRTAQGQDAAPKAMEGTLGYKLVVREGFRPSQRVNRGSGTVMSRSQQ